MSPSVESEFESKAGLGAAATLTLKCALPRHGPVDFCVVQPPPETARAESRLMLPVVFCAASRAHLKRMQSHLHEKPISLRYYYHKVNLGGIELYKFPYSGMVLMTRGIKSMHVLHVSTGVPHLPHSKVGEGHQVALQGHVDYVIVDCCDGCHTVRDILGAQDRECHIRSAADRHVVQI
jgi:hypothetical protein